MTFQLPLLRLTLAVCLSVVLHQVVVAADFRVESRVFVGKEDAPQSSNVTLFQGAHAFDFLDQPQQIAFYDLARGRIVLVDPGRRIKAEVSRATLDAFCNNLRHLEKGADDPILRFALRPVFDEQDEGDDTTRVPAFEEGDDEVDTTRVFSSKYVTYMVQPIAEEVAGMASRYHSFSDASARLNALVNRGSLPPFPRLLVNQALATKDQLPAQVQLTVTPARLVGGRTVVLRSEHEFRPRLLASDLRKIDDAGKLLASAKTVTLGEYLRPASAE